MLKWRYYSRKMTKMMMVSGNNRLTQNDEYMTNLLSNIWLTNIFFGRKLLLNNYAFGAVTLYMKLLIVFIFIEKSFLFVISSVYHPTFCSLYSMRIHLRNFVSHMTRYPPFHEFWDFKLTISHSIYSQKVLLFSSRIFFHSASSRILILWKILSRLNGGFLDIVNARKSSY